jgi:hypothetical protein
MSSKPPSPTWTSTTSDPDPAEHRPARDRRRRFRDAPHLILVGYGLVQACVTTLMVFDVITTTTITSAVTAVALILYVAANELLLGPRRTTRTTKGRPDDG